MEGHFSTGQSPQWAVVPMEEEVLIRMRNVSDKSCRENRNTPVMFNNFSPENRAFYEIMWKNIVQ